MCVLNLSARDAQRAGMYSPAIKQALGPVFEASPLDPDKGKSVSIANKSEEAFKKLLAAGDAGSAVGSFALRDAPRIGVDVLKTGPGETGSTVKGILSQSAELKKSPLYGNFIKPRGK